MRKFIDSGNRVRIIGTEQINLGRYIGSTGTVGVLRVNYVPASVSVILDEDNAEATFYVRDLEVIPPEDSIFQHGETVKVTSVYKRTQHHIFKPHLLDRMGEIRGYDHRDDTYYVECGSYGGGWFPLQCLLPIEYRGETFFYPNQRVSYEDRICVVQKVRKTNSNLGQLLYIEGQWVPSTSVTETENVS